VIRGISWPPSIAKAACASGSVPRAMSVNVWARSMASEKVLTGKLYWQGAMGLWPALARMALTPMEWTFSCCKPYQGVSGGREER